MRNDLAYGDDLLRKQEDDEPYSPKIVSPAGLLTVGVAAFSVGGFSFEGGFIELVPNGTWYVGIELSSKQLRALPRLGHRGWVPVARIETSSSSVVSISQIQPKLPECRIPRTMAKVLANKSINVVIMGSSLTQSDGSGTSWPGMVFGGGDIAKYKLPGGSTTVYAGVGAAPNQYQLAQVGLASGNGGYGYGGSGYPGALTEKTPPNGRSGLFTGVDLVVIGCLANGGDYRLETIEPLVRKLRQIGVEVLMVTDNPQNPTTDYATLSAAPLYVDGGEVVRVADLYGVEVADTAAYVFEAHLRSGGVGIYGDSIHQATGTATGPSAVLPANGHEAWARAVRSIFPVTVAITSGVEKIVNGNFSAGTANWLAQNGSTFSVTGGVATLGGNASFLALTQDLPTINPGSTVNISLDIVSTTGAWDFGLTNGGSWDAGGGALGGAGTGYVGPKSKTFVNVASGLSFWFWNSAGSTANSLSFDNVSVIVTESTIAVSTPDRPSVNAVLPPVRVVTDLKTPADAFVILPKDENYLVTSHAAKGTLGAHPWGAGSFSRRWGSFVGATSDLLTLTVGKKACISAICPVGYALVHYRDVADGACAFTVSFNGAVIKTVNVGAVPFGNEWFLPLMTPTEFAATGVSDGRDSYEITVTSGTLMVAAFVALTADVDYLSPEEIVYVGNWLPREVSRSGLPGRPTDTLGAFAFARCTGRRLMWIVSSNPGSRNVDVYSGREITLGVNTDGNYHIKGAGLLIGPGDKHFIRCAVANGSGDQANGHALHVGGAVIINDR